MTNTKRNSFIKLGFATIAAVYLLILVGGIVRSSGSGMGCPDWPKCFGSWVPPTSVDQLPDNYQDIYSHKRHLKNLKFSTYLDLLGFKDQAEHIRNDDSIRQEAHFNVYKTWIEYVNRIVGVVIGLLIFSTFVASLSYWKRNKSIVWLSFASFVLVVFQGWIGSIVVSTNLLTWTITVHMMLALLLVALLIYTVFKAGIDGETTFKIPGAGIINKVLGVGVVLFLLQIVIGTQVREAVDVIAANLGAQFRDQWVDQLGLSFYLHRSYSIMVLLVHIYLVYLLFKHGKQSGYLLNLGRCLLLLFAGEIITGVVMAYFAIPAFAQPIHLLLSTLIFGVQMMILFSVNFQVKTISEKLTI